MIDGIAPLFAGAIAGYAIAIPVGAIALLIIRTGLERGFLTALGAALGAATADFVYASAAMFGGPAIASLVTPALAPLRLIGAAVLVVIALRNLVNVRAIAEPVDRVAGGDALRTYGRFLSLTLLNPATVLYFAALTIGLRGEMASATDRAVFVIGVAGASASWQIVLATFGSVLHGRLGPQARVATGVAGSVMILAFAAWIALEAL